MFSSTELNKYIFHALTHDTMNKINIKENINCIREMYILKCTIFLKLTSFLKSKTSYRYKLKRYTIRVSRFIVYSVPNYCIFVRMKFHY